MEIKSKLIESELIENEVDKIIYAKEEIKNKKEKTKRLQAPIQQVKHILKTRSPKGKKEIVIGGIPIDVFDIEDMVIKVSPSDMKTVLRYDNARVIEHMRNTQRPKLSTLGEGNWTLLIILIIAAGGFLMFALFGGDILSALSSFFSF